MGDKKKASPSTGEASWNLISDNAVGAGAGMAVDMIQNGSSYAYTGPNGTWSPGGLQSPTANSLGNLNRTASGGINPKVNAAIGKAAPIANGLMSGVGLVGGVMQTAQGVNQLVNGQTSDGLLNTAAGVGSATSGGVGLAATLGSTTAVGGTGALGMGTSVAAAGALPVAATVGGGLAAGITIGQRSNSYIADTGLLGQNADGSGRSWSDWAGDAGIGAYEASKDAGVPEWAAQTAMGSEAHVLYPQPAGQGLPLEARSGSTEPPCRP